MDAGKRYLFHPVSRGICFHSLQGQQKSSGGGRGNEGYGCDLKKLGLIERIIPEEEPAGTDTLYRIAAAMDQAMTGFFETYLPMSGRELAEHRYQRFRRM